MCYIFAIFFALAFFCYMHKSKCVAVARTTVLDPVHEPIVGARNIIALNYNNDQQIWQIFDQNLEEQSGWQSINFLQTA